MNYTYEIPNLEGLQAAFARAPEVTLQEVTGAMNRATQTLAGNIKQRSPIDSGRLRDSILPSNVEVSRDGSATVVTGSVGTNVEYACIFGANTTITTKDGNKTIGQIQIGDMVLTQAGDYQPVIAKSAFPAREKPDLIDIEIPWRKGRNHKVTVTIDHKILVFREGRNKWIPAGDLVETDLLYHRKKISPAKGTREKKTCLWCNQEYQGQGRRYCSQKCKGDHWNSGANPHIGMKRSQATRDKLREANLIRLEKHPETHINRILAQRGRRTACETEVKEWLDLRGIEYIEQHKIGGHYADFFVPESNMILEADGAYWHQDQARDIKRDREIKDIIEEATIVHLHFFDKRFSPTLNKHPGDGIYYVPCNPGPDSFVDPEQFEAVKIISLKQWRYRKEKSHPRDGRTAKLYDLTVANVHSFFANGILVSNSWNEVGTGIYGPYATPIVPKTAKVLAFTIGGKKIFAKSVKGQPGTFFFRDGLAASRGAIDAYFKDALNTITATLTRP